MILRGLFQNRRVVLITSLFALLTAIYLLLNIFVVGGDEFFNSLNTILPAVAALLTSFFSYQGWANKKDPIARRFWFLMVWAFGLWGLAEIIWAFYSLVLQDSVPYPSLADLVWVIGYIPLYGALISRLQTLKLKFTRRQLAVIVAINFTWLLLVSFFIMAPMLQDWEPGRWLESITNLVYPTGDLGLVALASLILILLQSGRFAIVWRLIITGIVILTFSDQLFTYGSWYGLYYPDGQVNLLTNLADTSYTLAYVFIGYGIYLYRAIWDLKDEFELRIKSTAMPRYYAFVATNQQNQVIHYSENLFYLVKDFYTTDYDRQPLEKVLGIDQAALTALIQQVKANSLVANQPLCVVASDGEVRKTWITALAVFNPGSEFVGMNMALRADITDDPRLMLPDDDEIMSMLRYLQEISGTHPEDRIQTVHVFFQETIELFAMLLYQFGGEKFRGALFQALDQTIQKQGLRVKIEGQEVHLPDLEEAGDLAKIVGPLLRAARRFTVDLIGEPIVSHDYQELEKQFTPQALQDLAQLHLRFLN